MTDRAPLWCALALANRGWKVFPLAPSSKQPLGSLAPNGFHSASNDPEQLRKWWTARPEAGVGLALKDSGLVCVDVDSRNGGLETLERLEGQHGKVESEVMAYTPGGGMHFVFAAQLVGNLPGTLGKGIDLKADGYICVEPTIHPNGRAYAWEASSDPMEGCMPSALPGWIRDLSRAPLALSPSVASSAPPMPAERRASLIQALGHVDADSRESWLSVGMAIHNELPTAEGFDLWSQWSQSSAKFDAKDQLHVWRSFKPRGLAGVGVNSIFKMAQLSGWRNAPQAATVAESGSLLPLLNIAQLEQASGSITWAVKHVIPADSVGVLFGASGTFKSFIALDYALHCVHGMTWLGKKTKKAPVIFIAAEGGAGVWRRVKAWHLARGLSWAGIEFYTVPLAVMLNTQAGEVVEAVQAVGVTPGTVIVDTMSQTFDGEENSANEVAGYFRELGTRFRALWRCVVMVIHHSGHSATERPRGSSAILANVDFMLGCFRDEKEMISTLTCEKQKDGERFEPVQFSLTNQQLSIDEDGEAVDSLAARHINGAQDLIEAHLGEARAGRTGRMALLLEMAHSGMTEKELRLAFYKELADLDTDSKKKAFYRARDAAIQAGMIDFGTEPGSMERRLIVLKEWK
jgi:hypothetical protein